MLTYAYSVTYVIMTHTDEDRIICLFNTNILYKYISCSLPSLYGRLDFFHNHDIVSRTRELLGCFKGGLSSIASHQVTGLCLLPRIPNQTWTFVFCLAPTNRVSST